MDVDSKDDTQTVKAGESLTFIGVQAEKASSNDAGKKSTTTATTSLKQSRSETPPLTSSSLARKTLQTTASSQSNGKKSNNQVPLAAQPLSTMDNEKKLKYVVEKIKSKLNSSGGSSGLNSNSSGSTGTSQPTYVTNNSSGSSGNGVKSIVDQTPSSSKTSGAVNSTPNSSTLRRISFVSEDLNAIKLQSSSGEINDESPSQSRRESTSQSVKVACVKDEPVAAKETISAKKKPVLAATTSSVSNKCNTQLSY